MTLMPRRLLAQQGSDAHIPAEDFRLALLALMAGDPSGALKARSGVVPGTGSVGFTACQVTSSTASTLVIKPGLFVVQSSTTNAGAWIGIIDADTTRTLTPPSAGNWKAGYVIAHAYDEAYGDAQDGFDLEVILGTAATSVGAAAYPAIPSNALRLASFTVAASGAISFTDTSPTMAVARGGIRPVVAGDTAAGSHDGAWRDEPNLGLQRFSTASSSWTRPHHAHWGAGTSYPTSGYLQVGDTYVRTDLGPALMRWNGASWRAAERPEMSNSGWRGLSTGSLYPGFEVLETTGNRVVRWDGTFWRLTRREVYEWDAEPGSSMDPATTGVFATLVGPLTVPGDGIKRDCVITFTTDIVGPGRGAIRVTWTNSGSGGQQKWPNSSGFFVGGQSGPEISAIIRGYTASDPANSCTVIGEYGSYDGGSVAFPIPTLIIEAS